MMHKYHSDQHYKLAYEWFLVLDGDCSQRSIARILDVSPKTLRYWSIRGRPETERWTTRINPEKLNEARKFLDDGASYTEVSNTTGISRRTLVAHFPGRGWSKEKSIQFMVETRRLNAELKKVNYAS